MDNPLEAFGQMLGGIDPSMLSEGIPMDDMEEMMSGGGPG